MAYITYIFLEVAMVVVTENVVLHACGYEKSLACFRISILGFGVNLYVILILVPRVENIAA
jgi:hypothetical protein